MSRQDGVPGWRLVAAREIAVKVRDKTFLLSTAFMLTLVVGSIGLSAFLSDRSQSFTVSVVDAAGTELVQAANRAGGQDGARVSVEARTATDVAQAEQWVQAGRVDAALLPLSQSGSAPAQARSRWEVVGESEVDSGLTDLLTRSVDAAELEANARAAGTSAQEVLAGTVLAHRLLDPGELDGGLRYVLAFAFAFLFYITAMVFGLSIAQSVIEEKQSRVVEILAATLPVRQLLLGKVVGNTLLAIGQVVLLAGVGLIGLALSGRGTVLSLVLGASVWFVVFFVLGFVALACIWAVAGSVATRQEDLQATTMPVQAIVFVALFVGIAGSGTLLTIASFVPLVSSVAMPVRMLSGDVPVWQPAVAVLLVVVVAFALVRLGARLYEGSLLRTDRRTRLRDALARDTRM